MVRNATALFLPPKFHNTATKKKCFALAIASVSLEKLKRKKAFACYIYININHVS